MIKTYISILSVVVACTISLHAMELEKELLLTKSPSINGYESLTEDTFYVIQEQQQTQHKIVKHASSHYHPVTSVALSDMRQYFCNMPDDHKRTILKTMSTQLLLLTCIATYLPQDVVQNYICFFMLAGSISPNHKQEKDMLKKEISTATEKFYNTPIIQAFDVYRAIKIWLSDDTKPIGPLYALDEAEQNALLGIQSTWYYATPIINGDEEKLLEGLSDELKHMYLKGKEPVVLDKETSKKLCKAIAIGSSVYVVISGSIIGLLASCNLLWIPPLWIFGITLPGGLSGFATCQYYNNYDQGCCCRENTFLDI